MAKAARERRRHLRVNLPCPIALCDRDGNVLHKSRTENISDGGAFLAVPVHSLPRLGGELHVALAVPRATANTYMLENIRCTARVVRQQPLTDSERAGMAVQFAQPQRLMLVV